MKQIVINNISTTYYITPNGECYSSLTNKYLKGQINSKNGYKTFNLTLPDGSKKRCYAHRLVANAYLPNPQNKPEINHIDGNKLNNYLDNLEWVTSKENKIHAFTKDLYNKRHVFCFTKEKQLVAEYVTIAEAFRATKIAYGLIQQEVNKAVKSLSGGFYWSYDKVLGETKTYSNNGKSKLVNQYDLNGKFIISYPSTGVAAKAVGGQPSHIGECCRGKIRSYKRCIWKYAEDIVSTSQETESSTQY